MDNRLTLKKIAEELGKLARRVESIEKTVDLLSTDERNVLEDINARLAAIEEQMAITRRHDETVRKDIKEEVQLAGDRVAEAVENKVSEIQNVIQNKKVIHIEKKHFWTFWKR